jgi:hypothetical protein
MDLLAQTISILNELLETCTFALILYLAYKKNLFSASTTFTPQLMAFRHFVTV